MKLMAHHIERTIEPFFNILLSPCRVLNPLFKVYFTSITMVLSGEEESLQPFLSPIVQIYAALKTSFVAVLADREAPADGLNPFMISQTARTISCGNIGISIKTCTVLKGAMRPVLTNAHDTMPKMPKTRPQTDIHRGTNFVW